MSISGLDYSISNSLVSNERLLIHYDFTDGTGTPLMPFEEEGPTFLDSWGVNAIRNQEPASNTGAYSGIINDSRMYNDVGGVASRRFSTGVFLSGDSANLMKSNLKVNTPSLDYSSLTALFDVQFSGVVDDGILFGSLEKTSTTLNDEVITGAKGFNFGVNDRGKLFYQGFDTRGDFIYTASSIELSRRNFIGFSVDSNNLQISRFDYLNRKIEKEDFLVDTSFLTNNEEFYLGGSPNYLRGSSGEYKTFSGELNRFALFSGSLPPSLMMRMGSGMMGDYFFSAGVPTEKEIVTGYRQTTVYETGITGYTHDITGTIEVLTGREMLTGSLTAGTPHDTGEGARYFKYYTLNNGDVETAYKEELGFLHPDSGYQYLPTGDGAFATLGLRPVSGDITPYTITEGTKTGGSVFINLYGSVAQTGITSNVSGVAQTAVTQTLTIPALDTSGINLLGDSEFLKKNYIYFLGERI